MKNLIAALAVACMSLTLAACPCDEEEEAACEQDHYECTISCNPLVGDYDSCVDDCNEDLCDCLDDANCGDC